MSALFLCIVPYHCKLCMCVIHCRPTPRNIDIITKLVQRGVYFLPISGRMIANMAPLVYNMGPSVAMSENTYIAGDHHCGERFFYVSH